MCTAKLAGSHNSFACLQQCEGTTKTLHSLQGNSMFSISNPLFWTVGLKLCTTGCSLGGPMKDDETDNSEASAYRPWTEVQAMGPAIALLTCHLRRTSYGRERTNSTQLGPTADTLQFTER